jgi:phosphate transport system substrate-binding protein
MSNIQESRDEQPHKGQACNNCTFDGNPETAEKCMICGYELRLGPPQLSGKTLQPRDLLSELPFRVSRLNPKKYGSLLLLSLAGLIGFGALGFTLVSRMSEANTCVAPSIVTSSNVSDYIQLCEKFQQVIAPKGQFFYGGAMGAAAMRSPKVVSNISQAHPEFRLRYLDPLNIAPDSATGIKMVLNGDLSFAESQRALRDSEYKIAESRGFKLKQIPVAITGVVFYVNPQLKIKGLSYLQLQAIYTGQVSNWQELGGPNLPIVPVSQDQTVKGSNIGLLMDGLDPENQRLSSAVVKVRDNTTAIREVAGTPGAIGYGIQAITVGQKTIRLIGVGRGNSKNYIEPFTPEGELNKEVIRDGRYPLIQRIFVIVRADGTLDELAGVAYANLLLSKEGQQLVDTAGYVSIR